MHKKTYTTPAAEVIYFELTDFANLSGEDFNLGGGSSDDDDDGNSSKVPDYSKGTGWDAFSGGW